jgi:hypothetical protein
MREGSKLNADYPLSRGQNCTPNHTCNERSETSVNDP